MNPTHAIGHHARPECRGPHNTLYFNSKEALITEKCVQVKGAWHPIHGLSGMRIARGPGGSSPVAFSSGAVVATVGLFLGNVLVHTAVDRIMIDGTVGLLAATLGATAAVTWQHRPYELWVRCRGEWLRLYSCRDRVEFGKFRRALERAIAGELRTPLNPNLATFF